LSHRQYQESMQKLKESNDTLGKLTAQGIEMEPLRKGRSRSTQKYKSIQRHAGNLYKVIRRRWLCDCGAPHNANLRLDSRLLDHDTWTSSHDRGKATHDAIEFKVLFTVKTNNTSDSTSWSWQETEIRLLDQQYPQTGQSDAAQPGHASPNHDDVTAKSIVVSESETAVTSSPSQVKEGTSKPKKVRFSLTSSKSVKFMTPAPTPVSAKDRHSISKQGLSHQAPSHQAPSNLEQIKNICHVMQRLSNIMSPQNCLGYLCEDGLQPLGVYLSRSARAAYDSQEVISLADLLSRKNAAQDQCLVTPGNLLSRADRLSLALTIASSVLQLYQTPWLREKWDKHDILIKDCDKGPYQEEIYVSGTFSSSTVKEMTEKPSVFSPVRNEALFALGIVLIELCLGQPLENLRRPEDPLDTRSQPNAMTDWETACRLMESVEMESGKRYRDAVRRCIWCDFDQSTTTLDNDEFRLAVYNGVVAPLEEDMKDCFQR